MFSYVRTVYTRIPKTLQAAFGMTVLGISLQMVGQSCNEMVAEANGGRRPVATQTEDVLFVIGSPKLGVDHFPPEKLLAESRKYQPMKSGVKYALLADRIPRQKISPDGADPHSIPWRYLEEIGVPPHHDEIMSLGDLVGAFGRPMKNFGGLYLFFYLISLPVVMFLKKPT